MKNPESGGSENPETRIEHMPSVEWRSEQLVNGLEVAGVSVDTPPKHIETARAESDDFLFESINNESPALFAMGHNGVYVPVPEMQKHTDKGIVAEAEKDYGADHVVPKNVSFIGTQVSRFVADPNRPQSTEDGKIGGGGTFWTESIVDQIPFYTEPPGTERRRELAEKFHTPYYERIRELIDEVKERHDFCIFIDSHSFGVHERTKPSFAHIGINDPAKELPLFVISTVEEQEGNDPAAQFFQTFLSALQDHFSELSQEQQNELLRCTSGDLFSINHPFNGGNITRTFSDPDHDVYALQIESHQGALTYTLEDDTTYFSGKIKQENTDAIRSILQQTLQDTTSFMRNAFYSK